MKKLRTVNGFAIGEEVEIDGILRHRGTIVSFSGDGKRVHLRMPAVHGLVWCEVSELQKKSDEPRTGYRSLPTPL